MPTSACASASWPSCPTSAAALDNLLKSAMDALTHAGVWADDSQIDSLLIERAPTLGGMLKVEVEAL